MSDSPKPSNVVIGVFESFLEWRLPARHQGRLAGDALSSLSRDWEMWLAYLNDAERTEKFRILRSVESDTVAQGEFFLWLGELPSFSETGEQLARYQLVQCQGFTGWSELRRWVNPTFPPSDCGVSCLFLLGKSEDNPGVVKAMVGTFGPEVKDAQTCGKILPLNFSLSGSDEAAWQALDEAKRSAAAFFGFGGIIFWTGYCLAGDFLLLTVYRSIRILALLPRIRRALTHRNIYLQINTHTGGDVAGPSLGLAACIAAIMSVARLPGEAHSRFLQRFMPRLLGGLAGCAITGRISRGRLEPVRGIRAKLQSLRDSAEIRRALIPRANDDDLRPTRPGLITDAFIPPVGVVLCRHVLTALARLVPMRRTWLAVNIVTIVACLVGLRALPEIIHRHALPPIAISEVRTSAGAVPGPDISMSGIRVRSTDHITVGVIGHTFDGEIWVDASCPRGTSSDSSRQCLRISSDGGDWHSTVKSIVRDGRVDIDFELNGGTVDSCKVLSLIVVHRGVEMVRALVPIVLVGERIKPAE